MKNMEVGARVLVTIGQNKHTGTVVRVVSKTERDVELDNGQTYRLPHWRIIGNVE